MKKTFILFGLALTLAACNSKKSVNDNDTTTTSASATTSNITTGKGLIEKNDCSSCHKLDEKVIGPAYIDIANKYKASPAVIDTLANKVIKGGSGNWGTAEMTPHPTLSIDDARTMVSYILSLKK